METRGAEVILGIIVRVVYNQQIKSLLKLKYIYIRFNSSK